MSGKTRDGGRYATVRTNIKYSSGKKSEEITGAEERTTDTLIGRLAELGDESLPQATVTESVTTTVQNAERYGDDDWDIVPYRIEVTSSVCLAVAQDAAKLREAQEIAHELAFNSVLWTSKHALRGHRINIRTELYPGLFNDQD